MYAEVCVGYPVEGSFVYGIPEGSAVKPGMRVRVDFSGRKTVGFVIGLRGEKPAGIVIKDIGEIIDAEPLFDARLVRLAEYTARTYLSYTGEVLGLALPSGLRPSGRPGNSPGKSAPEPVVLTGAQRKIFDDILASIRDNRLLHLIFGITGSGKTEVYLELARRVLKQNASVIYLVPEISLSSQVFGRLSAEFGDSLIVYHSQLTPNQRLHNWMRFYSGDAKVAIGTRSASFLQCPRLGLIIIDEEHDASFKEHGAPRYNARRIALYRSSAEKALLVMGSATPSIETLHAAEQGSIALHTLNERYGGAQLPEIDIVGITPGKPDDILSPILRVRTIQAVEKGRQAIFLLNRRGFAPLVMCGGCGWTLLCPHCNIGMSYHRNAGMQCHYCGEQSALPDKCPACGGGDIVKLGVGTQRAEDIIASTLKGMNIFRLDRDSNRKKGTMPELMEGMNSGKVDILVGTQLVAKGFDFHNVVLVGVLMADVGLNLPDFRASERIFSLLMQVSGRSGRGDHPGRVIIQTLNPDNDIFSCLRNHDYLGFYRSELAMRKMLNYPPFARLARLLARGKDEAQVRDCIGSLKIALEENIRKQNAKIELLGPSSAPLQKVGGNHRHHIILKSRDAAGLRNVILASRHAGSSRDVYLEIDIDPVDLL